MGIEMGIGEVRVSRKAVIAGAGVGLGAAAVAGCSSGGDSGSGSSENSAPDVVTQTADVPVGSGVIVGTVVVTQPVAGDFKAFSAVCTHTGCLLNEVADGTINCPCHGSKFSLDGAVLNGPAARPLIAEPITVRGDSIVLS